MWGFPAAGLVMLEVLLDHLPASLCRKCSACLYLRQGRSQCSLAANTALSKSKSQSDSLSRAWNKPRIGFRIYLVTLAVNYCISQCEVNCERCVVDSKVCHMMHQPPWQSLKYQERNGLPLSVNNCNHISKCAGQYKAGKSPSTAMYELGIVASILLTIIC